MGASETTPQQQVARELLQFHLGKSSQNGQWKNPLPDDGATKRKMLELGEKLLQRKKTPDAQEIEKLDDEIKELKEKLEEIRQKHNKGENNVKKEKQPLKQFALSELKQLAKQIVHEAEAYTRKVLAKYPKFFNADEQQRIFYTIVGAKAAMSEHPTQLGEFMQRNISEKSTKYKKYVLLGRNAIISPHVFINLPQNSIQPNYDNILDGSFFESLKEASKPSPTLFDANKLNSSFNPSNNQLLKKGGTIFFGIPGNFKNWIPDFTTPFGGFQAIINTPKINIPQKMGW